MQDKIPQDLPEADFVRLFIRWMLGERGVDIAAYLKQNLKNWEELKDIAICYDIAPFVYPAIREGADASGSLSDRTAEGLDFFKASYYSTLKCSEQFWLEFVKIASAFEDKGIELLPIKGIALLKDIYKNRPSRPMSDIDILIKEPDIEKALKIMSGLGYEKELECLKEEYWRRHHFQFTMRRHSDNMIADMHWELDFKRNKTGLLAGLWKRARKITLDGREVSLPSPEDTLFSIALHNRRYGRPLACKNAYDIILLLNKYKKDFDWDYFLRACLENNLSSTVFFALYHAEFLSSLNLPSALWRSFRVSAWKKNAIRQFISKNALTLRTRKDQKRLFLKSHFLLYDSMLESVKYILHIPKEQFAKYYGIDPYSTRSGALYRMRFLYMPLKAIVDRRRG